MCQGSSLTCVFLFYFFLVDLYSIIMLKFFIYGTISKIFVFCYICHNDVEVLLCFRFFDSFSIVRLSVFAFYLIRTKMFLFLICFSLLFIFYHLIQFRGRMTSFYSLIIFAKKNFKHHLASFNFISAWVKRYILIRIDS